MDSRQEGCIVDKEEKLSGRVTGPKQLISFFLATWITRKTWHRYTTLNFLLLSGPISTDFHNGSTYECTHLSPTFSSTSLNPQPYLCNLLYNRSYIHIYVYVYISMYVCITCICMYVYVCVYMYTYSFSIRSWKLQVSVILSRNVNSRLDNRTETWLIFWFASFIYAENAATFLW